MSKTINSLLFFLASFLTVIMSILAVCSIWAKEKAFHSPLTNEAPFLANKARALIFYKVFSPAYDILNPHLYSTSMRTQIVSFAYSGKKENLNVLDVGCGTGYTTTEILNCENVDNVAGIDMNPKQLTRAQKNLDSRKRRLSLFRGDVENLPFDKCVFDAVISVGAIEYFPRPERAIKEMSKVLKPGGKLVVAGPELSWFRKLALHRFFYTPSAEEMGVLFKKARLQDVRSVFTGLTTILGTNRYVVVAMGTKANLRSAFD